jgi:DNA replication protein DnaC
MENKETLRAHARELRLYNLMGNLDALIHQAQQDKPTYLEFLTSVLSKEMQTRRERDFKRRLSSAHLPSRHNLDDFDYNFCSAVTPHQIKELRELTWLDQAYNIILMGPSGTGKTYIAAGLVYEAVKAGLKAYMMPMEELMTIIKMKELSPTAMATYNKLLRANLLAIDDIMLLPAHKEDAAGFFNLINQLHERASVIITTNKAPTEWAETLNDQVIASALLDRLLYRCEVIKLKGNSYRMENRKTIFSDKQNTPSS